VENKKPLVSIIIPHKPKRRLDVTINSINNQTYQDLEVIIQFDRGENNANVLRNKGEVGCNGEFLLFCDDDIHLQPTCIEQMVSVLLQDPDISFVYCNYDQVGIIHGTEYAQEFDIQKLKIRNYISTMSLVRRSDFVKVDGFDESLTRYQDWDLWLRMAEAGYQGHYINDSLFKAMYYKEGISLQGPLSRKVNTEVIKRRHNIKAYTYSIIIPVHNQLKYTKACIDSVIRHTAGDYELILIDDGSTDGTKEFFDSLKHIARVFTHPKRLHHTACVTEGAEMANGDYIILLNNDTLVPAHWNVKMKEHFGMVEDISCIGPLTSNAASVQKVTRSHDLREHLGVGEINVMQKIISDTYESIVFKANITGFCMMTTKAIWKMVGPFLDSIPAGGNEAEWIIRAFRNHNLYPYVDTSVYVHHFGNCSYVKEKPKELWAKGRGIIIKEHGQKYLDWLEEDLFLKHEYLNNLPKKEVIDADKLRDNQTRIEQKSK
jgi:glycosyltransferase involved in cell wall biosynthesis